MLLKKNLKHQNYSLPSIYGWFEMKQENLIVRIELSFSHLSRILIVSKFQSEKLTDCKIFTFKL